MSNDAQLPSLLTSSQESMVMRELDLQVFFPDQLLYHDPPEAKYDISQLGAECVPEHHGELLLPDHSPQGQVPANEEFEGKFNFQVMPDQQDDTKSWVYSQKLKKVFIEMDKTLPVRIKWTQLCNGLRIKAAMAYCQPTHRSEPVKRCHNHVALSNQETPYLHHVLSCKNSNAIYNKFNEFYSVTVPLETPQPGSDSVQMDFVFHCKNSCSTGINRRLTEIVFTLEDEAGNVLGRRKLLVRICSCPKRDREKEEKLSRDHPGAKKRKIAPGKKLIHVSQNLHPIPDQQQESEIFTFSARIFGRENYEQLIRIAYGLMLETMERTGQRNTITPLLEELNRML